MNRRHFVAALAALPFVGKLVARDDVITLKPGESIMTPWMVPPTGLIPPIITYLERQPEIMRDLYCPLGIGYLIARERGAPPALIRSVGDEPIRKIVILDVATQGSLAKQWGLV